MTEPQSACTMHGSLGGSLRTGGLFPMTAMASAA